MEENTINKNRVHWRRGVIYFFVYAIFWLILVNGNLASWIIGLPVVIVAVCFSVFLYPGFGWHLHISGLGRFLPFFLSRSLLGSIDVAKRALDPRLPIAPVIMTYPFRLPEMPARIFLANVTSLLPGTLSTQLQDDFLEVHAIDEALAVKEEIGILEKRVADLFGLELIENEVAEDLAHE